MQQDDKVIPEVHQDQPPQQLLYIQEKDNMRNPRHGAYQYQIPACYL